VAHDKGLESRIDEMLDDREGYQKKKMFGGICYLKRGSMSFGIWRDFLIVRCGLERQEDCLSRPHTKVFDVTGKAMSGWVMVLPEGVEDDHDLEEWLLVGEEYATSLPPKKGL
jgi:hypothetical protein